MPPYRKFLPLVFLLGFAFITSGCGTGVSSTPDPDPNPVAPTVNFSANSTSIESGQLVTLSWTTSNATSVTIEPNVLDDDDGNALPLTGTHTMVLLKTTTFAMTATGPGGTTTRQVSVTVTPAKPTLTFVAEPASILAGQASTLRWSTTSADTLQIEPVIGSVQPGVGTVEVRPTATATYTATATGAGGTVTATATVTVAQGPELAVSASVEPATIHAGDKATLRWTSQNAASVSIAPDIGAVNAAGSVQVSPAATTAYTVTATSASGQTTTATATLNVLSGANGLENLKHIVFFVQENRSFDNYFGMLGRYRESKGLPNEIDGLNPDLVLRTFSGKEVKPFHQRTVVTELLSPSWNESHFYANFQDGEFRMDNWMRQEECSIRSNFGDPECTRTMGYYDHTDIPYYYELAATFATSDRFFSSAMSGTIVNRAFLMGATSAGMNDPGDPFPSEAPTIFRRLSEAGISWWYVYQDDSVYLAYYTKPEGCPTCDWDKYKENAVPLSKYYEVLSRPTADQDLPQVVFIEHAAKLALDEHTANNIQYGIARAQELIEALMKSTAWPSSVFILTHDEGGGLYDHVPPYPVSNPDGINPVFGDGDIGRYDNFTYSGFRVPLLVISPWVKPGFVSHRNREFTSILKLIQTRFGLAPLTQRDAEADDMLEFFDFTRPAYLTPPAFNKQPVDGLVNCYLEMYPPFTPDNIPPGPEPGKGWNCEGREPTP